MARLFTTPREFDFFSDIAKELMKDVSGQKFFYYPVADQRTPTNVYGESERKVLDQPVELEALIDVPDRSIDSAGFGADGGAKLTIYVHARDAIERSISLRVGDYASYGTVFYEIASVTPIKPMHGQIEHYDGYVLACVRARKGTFSVPNVLGPTSEEHTDQGAVQKLFVQQRGFDDNREGPTADVRDLRKHGVLDVPLTGVREVSDRGTRTGASEGFYDE